MVQEATENATKQLKDVRRRASLKIATTARAIRRHFDQRMADLGVTRSQWTVISIVSRSPGLTQRVLAEALEISEASTGRLVDRLCSDGLLERRPKEDDRRAHCVFLTEAGDALTSRLAETAVVCEDLAYADLSAEEVEELAGLLQRIAENLEPG